MKESATPIKKRDGERVDAYLLPNGKQLLHVKPQQGLDEKNPAVIQTRAVLNATLAAFTAEEEAANDKWLSALARSSRVAPKVETALAAIKQHRQYLSDCALANEAAEKRLFEIRRLDPADAVAAINEREVRDHFHGLAPDQRSKIMSEAAAGKHEGMLYALARSPVPGAVEVESARAILRARVERGNADQLRTIERTRDDLNAHLVTLQSCEQNVAEAAQRVAAQARDAT